MKNKTAMGPDGTPKTKNDCAVETSSNLSDSSISYFPPLPQKNFFNPSKKNSFGCAANRKIGKPNTLRTARRSVT
jgi:hypothetical protein